ncbi:MAG TPA: zinc ribbon domain-containing protein [Bryobacteraceae bacterium]|nr:zinc ribbon domain-containing protein [Bryobacteraceae bacterium]
MNLVIAVVVLVAATLLYTLFVRANDIPAPEPVSPTRHLEERRAAIYENLRDLQFEYRVGKLSDADYQQTKLTLQKELAGVMAEIAQVSKGLTGVATVPAAAGAAAKTVSVPVASKAKAAYACPHCGAEFPVALKFCGECGKEMS